MNTCPFFGKCGGCRFDFTAADYRDKKMAALHGVGPTDDAIWVAPGDRRRVDFCFAGGEFGMFAAGSKDIVPVRTCPNAAPQINAILPKLAAMPWVGAGAALVTLCENGIDVAITSNVPYCSAEFKRAADTVDAIRITWNGRVIKQTATPIIKFGDVAVEYPTGAFLQPGRPGEDAIRRMVADAATGARHVADLFCGLGNFTHALHADGFDITGPHCRRDLFKNPVTPGMLKQYDCVVMDPPRAGADAQSKILAKSDVKRIIYVSCNPATFARDAETLKRGGYKIIRLVPVDQFVGSTHWEIFSVFEK
ncbi:class I SAM-dependent RNA methyltransferase [bacterium]|nr:class I SAM-dependent RNA methyltransferase [bacterium]